MSRAILPAPDTVNILIYHNPTTNAPMSLTPSISRKQHELVPSTQSTEMVGYPSAVTLGYSLNPVKIFFKKPGDIMLH
ncbi:hypothetical protein T440DRAFT_463283 [Plenodomus tracheiphilus IPT5]|uniref:Uncharacterized protein n=1 Tax=Plenodomus tracheiphilus IPT5 TaxID=1408161 RepID=A0A6A7BKF0_9PLEO|nr:hypothetical protein T440DRAFT_463283 [Plenodomus tracheiphilus IPT5]